MAYDINLTLAPDPATAVTATTTHTAVDTKTGTPRRGLKARIVVSAVSGTTMTAAFKLQTSSDNTNFADTAFLVNANVTAVSATGEYYIPFETSSRYIRLVNTVAGATPSFTYLAHVVDSRP